MSHSWTKIWNPNWWFDVYTKHYKPITIMVTVLLLSFVVFFGWLSATKVREVVGEDFNRQQLVFARHAASQIEQSLTLLKREIALLSLSPSVQYADGVLTGERLRTAFSSVENEGVLEIRFVENRKLRSHVVNDHGDQIITPQPLDTRYLEWAGQQKNKEEIFMSGVAHSPDSAGSRKLILHLALPVRQVSIDKSHPVASNELCGVLLFVIDTTALIQRITKDIKSGKTGYSWVIDSQGTFLYHPEAEFIGKNAFEARKEKKPSISFTRINKIQKDLMLAGKEGMSWYVSGWHRGEEGEIKKLIAFTPIHLDRQKDSLIWSVAVVAPISEVEGAILEVQRRQFLLGGIGILITICGGLFIIVMMLRWSSTIKQEVEAKTRELKRSEYMYRSLVENANDIIFTMSIDGRILSMNSYGYSFFSKKPETVLEHELREFFPEESSEKLLKRTREVFATKISNQATCPVQVDGSEHWLSINLNGLIDEKGTVYKVLGIGRDITERKKMEEETTHTEKLASIGTLAAGVAHEINNPLAVILGFTDLLLEKVSPDSETYDLLKTIEKQGLNAKTVVESLLGFARHTERKEEEIDINRNLEEVLTVIGHSLKLSGVTTIKDFMDKLPKVKGDPREFQQVFFNIINNALATMKGGGILTIITRAMDDEQHVEVEISDTGPGIKKEHRKRIFDPLFTTKKVGEGTGLGLWVSYGIVTQYGGTITFETETEEESPITGTTFIIKLPVTTSGK